MAKMIQVRNVTDGLHAELVRRAKLRGQTLSDYIEAILEREVALPPREEVFARIHSRTAVELPHSAADYIREDRGSRDEK